MPENPIPDRIRDDDAGVTYVAITGGWRILHDTGQVATVTLLPSGGCDEDPAVPTVFVYIEEGPQPRLDAAVVHFDLTPEPRT